MRGHIATCGPCSDPQQRRLPLSRTCGTMHAHPPFSPALPQWRMSACGVVGLLRALRWRTPLARLHKPRLHKPLLEAAPSLPCMGEFPSLHVAHAWPMGAPPAHLGALATCPLPAPRTPPPDLPPDGLQPPNDPMPNLLIPAMPLHNSPPATDAPAATATTPTTIPGRPSLAAALPSPITPLPPVVHCAAPVDGRRSAATTPRSSVRS